MSRATVWITVWAVVATGLFLGTAWQKVMAEEDLRETVQLQAAVISAYDHELWTCLHSK